MITTFSTTTKLADDHVVINVIKYVKPELLFLPNTEKIILPGNYHDLPLNAGYLFNCILRLVMPSEKATLGDSKNY